MVIKDKQALIGGSIIALFGVLGLAEGQRLGAGALTDMGPGYVPSVLGVLLILFGFLMMRGETAAERPPVQAEWRGWICIVLGVLSFIVLGPYAGLVPATLSCVFISALGDRQATVKGAIVLALGVAAFGIVLFHYGLQINIPLFGGRA